MASKEEIKKAILSVAGNPESGDIWALADKMAEAVLGLDASESSKETRVIKPDLTR
jgi:hypothetical protein